MGSIPTEESGRKQEGAEGEAERPCATHLGLSQLHREIWSYSGPAELSQVGTRELGLYPTVLVSGYGLALEGSET